MNVETILSPDDLSKLWTELAQDDQLPDWYELSEHGEIVMSPKPHNRHQLLCSQIAHQLQTQLGGQAGTEVAVLTTTAGIRVPDVVWMPEERWQIVATKDGLVHTPELVVEVLTPGNRQTEINHKIQAYLSSGIQEILVVGLTGALKFYRQDGVHTTSSRNITLTLPPYLFQ
ncbi:MAG: Uma2 family endonuclease [Nitrospirales bacterium]